MNRRLVLAALIVLFAAPLGRAEQDDGRSRDDDPFRDHGPWPEKKQPGDEPPKPPEPLTPPKVHLPDKDLSEPLLEDEKDKAPAPPLVQADAGIVLWPFLRTSIRVSREGGDRGTRISSAEDTGGLARRAISPWIDATIGRSVRFGLSAIDLRREGEYTRVDEPVIAGGRVLANAGGYLETDVEYTQADAYVQWDLLAGKKYRIGLIGGARLIRIASKLRGIQTQPINLQTVSVSDVIWSPFFGGHLEFAPVPIFAFYANVRFIDWSWSAIGLQEQRTYEMRLGFRATIVPELFTAAFEFRFLSSFLDPADLNGGRNFSRYQLDAGGIAFVLGIQY